jgi:GntR family transcriptional regulator / MocR family aminotransferase
VNKEANHADWANLVDWRVEGVNEAPLYEQVIKLLQEQILAGAIPAGSRLLSTRQLMQRLGVSRTTAIAAYAQLQADGYVVGKVGSGTYVAPHVKVELIEAPRICSRSGRPVVETPPGAPPLGLSSRGKSYQDIDLDALVRPNVPFNTGMVHIDARTSGLWQQLVRQHLATDSMIQGYSCPQGSEALRQEITRYVSVSRGVRCTPDDVIVVAGSQQAIDLASKVLLDPADSVWIEDPGYQPTRLSLATAGMRLHHIPVDEDGMRIDKGIATCPGARAVFVTPSHQYPLGVSLSMDRRLQLLDWAERQRSWVVEDDYDSEFRYGGPSLPSLQGLDTNGRVVYVGTFSKVLQPGIRYGYLIVPPQLAKAFQAARFLTDRHSPLFLEQVLTDFIRQGHFVSNFLRMRTNYKAKLDVLVRLLNARASQHLDVVRPNQGLHLIAYLKNGLQDTLVADELAKAGVVARAISRLYAEKSRARSGLMLGFAGFSEPRLVTAVERLAAVVERIAKEQRITH